MPSTIKEASLKLDFLVVGGGLAGFAVAYALCKAGHRVRVLEKHASLGMPAGGLRVPPNMSKILKNWVGEEELRKTAVRNVGTPWYDMDTGEQMGYAEWKPAVMEETGGEFLMMKHEDVHRLLHTLAIAAGAKIQFGATVTSVTPGDPKPSVTLATGETLTSDIIIGADGPTSMVRRMVLDREDDAEPGGFTVFGGSVSADEMKKYPELEKWATSEEWPIFMGNNRSLCAHPIHAKKEFALQLYWPDEDSGTTENDKESWYDVVSVDTVKFDSCSPNVKRVIGMAPYLVKTRWMKRYEDIDYWSDESGRIVLIGEAAHPWFPGGTHGPAMALEDAVVFSTLFSHLKSWDQVGSFVSAYQEIREARTKAVNTVDVSNAELVRMPPGPDRDRRNESMRRARGEWDDGALQREFEGVAALFAYEAQDAAEEWWVNWGRFKENETDRETVNFGFNNLSVNGH